MNKPTPALKHFLRSVGKAVHFLNTVVVGLAGVESGVCRKPDALDVSWDPADPKSSSRSARAYTLKAFIVFLDAELLSYVDVLLKSPACESLNRKPTKADRFSELTKHLGVTDADLAVGPLLVIHWRNRIVHHKSTAKLCRTEEERFKAARPDIKRKYKNLDPVLTLTHFHNGTPTLKDVSSLIAMSIKCARALDAKLPEPTSFEELLAWIAAMGLDKEFERANRVSANAANFASSMNNFFVTYCPGLKPFYDLYGAD